MDNLILDVDSYKSSHYLQHPPGADGLFYYIESRGGRFPEVLFFGLQYFLERYLSKPIKSWMVDEAKEFFALHGEPFPEAGWRRVVEKLDGHLPIRIRAVPEGTVVPNHNVLLTIESTDPEAFWMPGWMETQILRACWYPTTVATQSRAIRQLIMGYLDKSSDDPKAEIAFKLHDFGARGVSSRESAMIGGAAHLVNFQGSDTVAGVWCANKYYDHKMAAFSIPAAEHSTITAWGRENEVEAYRNMLRQFAKPGAVVACVSDSYDLWNAIDKMWGGELREEVIKSGATLVVRPDSGDPPEVVLRALQMLDAKFGHTMNAKGYRVLKHVRVIQGDGVEYDSIKAILDRAVGAGYSATCLTFGMGGALLQKVDRDTQKFAYKCSAVRMNGVWRPVRKQPVTDPGKDSKAGRLDLVRERLADGTGRYRTIDRDGKDILLQLHGASLPSELVTVYENGAILKRYSLNDVRARAWS